MSLWPFAANQIFTQHLSTRRLSNDCFDSRRCRGQKPGPRPLPHIRFLRLVPANVPLRSHFKISSTGDVVQDVSATAAVLAGAYGLVFTFDKFAQQKLLNQKLSRKLVHILSGLLYVISWPIFSNSTKARYFAALVPLVNCLRLVVNGLSLASDNGLIKSLTREGNPKELLKGPLYYVLVLMSCAVLFWRESPVGAISLAMMCGGDGVADIFGRRFGTLKIPYNQRKSWAGSMSMFVFGFLLSLGLLYYYSFLGYLDLDWSSTVLNVALVSLVATVVESLPTEGLIDDNMSVPLASMAIAILIFR